MTSTILAIDPGNTVGWIIFQPATLKVLAIGMFPMGVEDAFHPPLEWLDSSVTDIVIEKPVGQGFTRPTMVETGIISGRIYQSVRKASAVLPTWMPRHEVKKILTTATYGEVHVRNDATAWAAIKLMFGQDCDRKGKKKGGQKPGIFAGVTSHVRAALALAVAYAYRADSKIFETDRLT